MTTGTAGTGEYLGYKVFESQDEANAFRETLPDIGSEKHIAAANRSIAHREESFERCDTDGFVTQFCDGLSASKSRLEADVAKHGGTWTFKCLLFLDGSLASTKMYIFPGWAGKSQYRWRIPTEDGGVRWVTDYSRESNFTKAGVKVGWIVAPCEIKYWHPLNKKPEPRGFGGLACVHPLHVLKWRDAGLGR